MKLRGKPIISMLEEIRTYLMRKMNDCKTRLARYEGPITPSSQSKLEQSKKNINSWHPLWAGVSDGSVFQVQHIIRLNERYVVDLKEYSCSYREWDLCGIPCPQAVACMGHSNLQLENFVHPYYWKETWERIYAPFIKPVRGENQCDPTGQEPVLPLAFSRGGGRPKKQRSKTNDVP